MRIEHEKKMEILELERQVALAKLHRQEFPVKDYQTEGAQELRYY